MQTATPAPYGLAQPKPFKGNGHDPEPDPDAPASAVQPVTAGRTMLTANLDWYVSATGSNGNPGTMAKPFADPVYAYQLAQRTLDLGGQYTITCHLIGNFDNVSWTFFGPLCGTGPRGFVIAGTGPETIVHGADGGLAILVGDFGGIQVRNLTMRPGVGGFGFTAMAACGTIYVDDCHGQTNGAHTIFDACGTGCGVVVSRFNVEAYGAGADYVAVAEDQSNIVLRGHWIFIGQPFWRSAFCQADLGGMIDATGFVRSGSGDGVRFNAVPPGIVFTGLGTGQADFFPGSSPGNGTNPWYQ